MPSRLRVFYICMHGMARHGMHGLAWHVMQGMACWHGMQGMAWHAWHGMARAAAAVMRTPGSRMSEVVPLRTPILPARAFVAVQGSVVVPGEGPDPRLCDLTN